MVKQNGDSCSDVGSGLRITGLGALVNIILAVSKITVGIWGHSRALVADGVHSLSDLATDMVTALGLYYGSQPWDSRHPYGHKRIETLAELVAGGLLLAFAGSLIYSSVSALRDRSIEEPSALVLVIVIASIASKEWLYQRTVRINRELGSGAMLVNAWHHRSDALTSLVALVAVGLAKIDTSLLILDPIAGIAISILVGRVGIRIGFDALKHLADTAPDARTIERIRKVTIAHEGVHGMHKVRARYLGGQIIVDLHIEVDPEITVREGHTIATDVEHEIMEEVGNIYDVTVHIEPLGPREKSSTGY